MSSMSPDLSKHLDSLRDSLNDLTYSVIPEKLYFEYKDIPQEQQSIKEYMSIRIYEMQVKNKNTVELLEKELDALREKYIKLENVHEQVCRDRDYITKAKKK